jgi:HAD superfamily hydrolase (TIGR01509 family)
MAKAVIFDRDGVLLDSEHCHVQSVVQTLQRFGCPAQPADVQFIVGRHPDDYKRELLTKYDVDWQKYRQRQRNAYYEIFSRVPLFDNTIDLVKRLHKASVPLALTTSASKQGTEEVLKRAHLQNIFDVLVTSEHYTKRKPDPEPYLVTAGLLGFDTIDCVAVEDSVHGLESAKAAGMKCIIIPNRYTKEQDFSSADQVFRDARKISVEYLFNL